MKKAPARKSRLFCRIPLPSCGCHLGAAPRIDVREITERNRVIRIDPVVPRRRFRRVSKRGVRLGDAIHDEHVGGVCRHQHSQRFGRLALLGELVSLERGELSSR